MKNPSKKMRKFVHVVRTSHAPNKSGIKNNEKFAHINSPRLSNSAFENTTSSTPIYEIIPAKSRHNFISTPLRRKRLAQKIWPTFVTILDPHGLSQPSKLDKTWKNSCRLKSCMIEKRRFLSRTFIRRPQLFIKVFAFLFLLIFSFHQL